jgi:hypothetical protein
LRARRASCYLQSMCAANALGSARVSPIFSRHALQLVTLRVRASAPRARVTMMGCAALLVIGVATAHAQVASGSRSVPTGDAASYLEAGKVAYAAGHFEAALHDFEVSYTRQPDTRTLYRIGDTADKLGWHERAVSAFNRYLALAPNAKDHAFIMSRVRANQAALAQAPPAEPLARAPEPAFRGGASSAAHGSTEQPRAWWLWAGAGALVVVGVAAAAFWLSAPAASTPEPLRGNIGPVVQTLHLP